MRVAVVTESFLPSANGVTTSVLRVLDYLSSHGHDAIVVCPGPAPDSYAGYDVVECQATHIGGFRAALPNPAIGKILADFRPDVLHAASPFVLGAQALYMARKLEIPSVAIFQTDVAGFARRHNLNLSSAAWKWLAIVHNGADLTLAPSSATLKDLRTYGFERTAYWGRGVDTKLFRQQMRDTPYAERLRERAGDGKTVVGYIGRLAQEKSVERLVPLAKIPGVSLVIVGDGPSRPELQRRLRGTNAMFLGKLSGEELASAYAALDIFVHTGTQETFGQTLQEAMASGVPVVAPASGGPLDTVAHGQTGLLYAPDDQKALNKAVASLVKDPAGRQAMGVAGRKRVEPRSWERICGNLVEYYECVISQKAAELQLV